MITVKVTCQAMNESTNQYNNQRIFPFIIYRTIRLPTVTKYIGSVCTLVVLCTRLHVANQLTKQTYKYN